MVIREIILKWKKKSVSRQAFAAHSYSSKEFKEFKFSQI